MKTWSDFYDYVVPELPGLANTDMVDLHLRDAAIDFCEQTWVLVGDHDPVSTIADIYEYELDSPESQCECFAIKQAWIDDSPIEPISMDDLWAANIDWRTSSGQPSKFAQQDYENVLLYAVPDAVYTLTMVVALRPTVTATGVPDRFYADYRKAIAFAAKANLMAQPAKPWSNPDKSTYYQTLYQAEITKTTVLVNRARARATLQVRYRTV